MTNKLYFISQRDVDNASSYANRLYNLEKYQECMELREIISRAMQNKGSYKGTPKIEGKYYQTLKQASITYQEIRQQANS